MKLVNLTPHTIVVGDIAIEASGTVARREIEQKQVGEVNGIPIYRTVFGPVLGLPDLRPDTFFIVSSLVLAGVADHRTDVIAPDTGPSAIRDSSGRIQGITRFISR